MMDANFRARCKDRGFDDIELAPGWAYYVEEKAYLAHVLMRADEKDLVRRHPAISLLGSAYTQPPRKTPVPRNIMRFVKPASIVKAISHQVSGRSCARVTPSSGRMEPVTCNKGKGELSAMCL